MSNTRLEQQIENSVKNLFKKSGELGELQNALGAQKTIDTYTAIRAKVTEQKLPDYRPSDYMPVVVGENAWFEDNLIWKSFNTGDNFEAGIFETGSNLAKAPRAETQVEGVRVPRRAWREAVVTNIVEVEQAARTGNWSLIEAKERARYNTWLLGIQKVSFLGTQDSALVGLLNQTGVASNTTVVTKAFKSMSATEFATAIGGMLPAYQTRTNYTAMPDTFVMPATDYNGLGSFVDEGYGNGKSRLARLKEAFIEITGNADFQVKPLPYADKANSGLTVDRYVLYRRNDDTSLLFEIPVDFTTGVADTFNGFNYESVAFGQFSSVEALRPLEMLYFDY
jgi:hypothetical protein